MKSKFGFKSNIKEAIYSSACPLHRIGVMAKTVMRSFDDSCLAVTPEFKPAQIRKMQIASKITQPLFARHLNTSESNVEKWQTGDKQPSGAALKFLAIVQEHGVKAWQV